MKDVYLQTPVVIIVLAATIITAMSTIMGMDVRPAWGHEISTLKERVIKLERDNELLRERVQRIRNDIGNRRPWT